MRLLNTSTLVVEEFLQRQLPEYVILSHTWGKEEVTLQDVQSGVASSKDGYAKLTGCCKKAAEDGFKYCWIDTCCIDKTSSAELSEAINSMYKWYRNARICYVYLADYNDSLGKSPYQDFTRSRWFTRGWTLQELIAPIMVEFYDSGWVEIGTRLSLQQQLMEITGISKAVLQGEDPSRHTVAVRMSWAARRQTSREEDTAYCLLGIFGVNMPLLYGEGTRAFRRLQEEIMRTDEDYTLFAWSPDPGLLESDDRRDSIGLLADSPSNFSVFEPTLAPKFDNFGKSRYSNATWHREDLLKDSSSDRNIPGDHPPPHLNSRGLRISLPLLEHTPNLYYACVTTIVCKTHDEDHLLCVVLSRPFPSSCKWRFVRNLPTPLVIYPKRFLRKLSKRFTRTSIYVDQPPPGFWDQYFHDKYLSYWIPGRSERPLLRVNVDPSLASDLTCVASPLVRLESLLQDRFGEDVKIKTPPFQVVMPPIPDQTKPGISVPEDRIGAVRYHFNFRGLERTDVATGIPDLCFIPDSPIPNVIWFQIKDCNERDLQIQFTIHPKASIHAMFVPRQNLRGRPTILLQEATTNALRYSDRAIVGRKASADGEDNGPYAIIKLSIRRAPAMSITPLSPQYVLTLVQERVQTRIITHQKIDHCYDTSSVYPESFQYNDAYL